MKASFIFLALLICGSLCASTTTLTTESTITPIEQSMTEWNPVINIQSATNRPPFIANSGTNLALIAAFLFSLLILSRRSQFVKN